MNTHLNNLFCFDNHVELSEADVTLEKLRENYKTLSRRYHPDLHKGQEDMFVKMQKSYEVLKGILEGDSKELHIELQVPVALTDLYTGVEKIVPIRRTNQNTTEDCEITVRVPAGAGDGYRIAVPAAGHIVGPLHGNLQVIVMEINDTDFKRVGADLHVWLPITLTQALTGRPITLYHFKSYINVDPRINYSSQISTMIGLGMPIPGTPMFGNLHINYNVIMPQITSRILAALEDARYQF